MENRNAVTVTTMIFGVIIFLATVAAWLWGEKNGVKTDILWIVAVPVITALFIGHQVGTAAKSAEQAAQQTNGTLNGRLEEAVTNVLAKRDITRAKQSISDAGKNVPPETIINEADRENG